MQRISDTHIFVLVRIIIVSIFQNLNQNNNNKISTAINMKQSVQHWVNKHVYQHRNQTTIFLRYQFLQLTHVSRSQDTITNVREYGHSELFITFSIGMKSIMEQCK